MAVIMFFFTKGTEPCPKPQLFLPRKHLLQNSQFSLSCIESISDSRLKHPETVQIQPLLTLNPKTSS